MGNVLILLFPLVLGSNAMPSWALLVFALLSSGRGTVQAIGVVAGVTLVRLLQGFVFGTLVGTYELDHHLTSLGGIVSALLIVFGILMWAMALSQVLQKDNLKLMNMVGALTPVKAVGLGALLVLTSTRSWIFTLAALGVIERGGLDIPQSVIAYLLYVIAAEALLIAPIVVSVRSAARFETVARLLEKYNRPIMVVASFAVGCFLLWTGISGFIA